MADKDLSLVIPVYNEVENLRPLLAEIITALDGQALDYEIIFVDDGSADGSFELLQTLYAEQSRVVVVRFRRNYGQTAAFAAGFAHARGRLIATLDADRQNDPADLPTMLAKLDEGYDVVNGWRQNRQDGFLLRRAPSYLANRLIAQFSKVPLHDRGCSLRLFRAEVIPELRLYGELHRFIPEMAAFAGFKMAEVPVNHRPRLTGRTKYGLSRTFRVLVDLFTILFLRRYSDRPMHFFASIGVPLGGLGSLALAYLVGLKLWAGLRGGLAGFQAMEIGERPLLSLAILFIIIGVQFLVMGLVAEVVVRTYYETQNKPVYTVQTLLRAANEPEPA